MQLYLPGGVDFNKQREVAFLTIHTLGKLFRLLCYFLMLYFTDWLQEYIFYCLNILLRLLGFMNVAQKDLCWYFFMEEDSQPCPGHSCQYV